MKRFKNLFFILSAFLFLAAPAAFAGGKSDPATGKALAMDGAVASGKLANGITYYALQNGEPANRIYLRLVVKAGSVLEADDQKGIAHLIEHMAFNGTAHFKKNQLVDYFESIGMAFGPEVNAYTAFDETVYMLEVPADNPEMLKNALLVLSDWASTISFDADELAKERGVVIEEWRLGRGASGRVSDKQLPFLFNGSRYGERLPIGDPEIVKNVSRDRIVDFYKEWYRPEAMTVVVSGDLDTAKMVSEISDAMGKIPASKDTAPRPWYSVTPRTKPAAIVIRDPELQYTSVQLLDQFPASGLKTDADLRERIVRNVAYSIFNNRLEEKITVADPLMLAARIGAQRVVKPTRFNFIGMVPATGKFTAAFTQLLEELARLERFGVTDAELARAKQSLLDSTEQSWLNRDKIPSANRAYDLVQYALNDETALSAQDKYDLYRAIVPGITAKDVAQAIDGLFYGRGMNLVVSAPESATDIPSEADLLKLWQDWKPAEPLAPYVEANLDRPLNDGHANGSGLVVKKEKLTDAVSRWTLSNGARVVLMPTTFKANEILFYAFSKGGTSLVSDAEYPSAAFASDYSDSSGLNGFSAVDLKKKLAGKTVGEGSWLDESYEGLSGHSSVSDFETLFQLINLQFTGLSFTNDGWQSLYAQVKTMADTRKNDPAEMFSDLKVRLLYGDNIRRANLNDSIVAAMKPDVAEAAFRARFADPADFTFVFVGSFDEATLEKYASTWLAGLPSKGTHEEAKPLGLSFPKGIVADSLKMGLDPQSEVFMAFGGSPKIEKGDYELFSALQSLLDIRFREVIREDMSGSYGVNVSGSLSAYPAPTYNIAIEFGCAPGKEDELSRAVIEQIKWLQGAPIPDAYITKLRETYRRNQEEGLKNNQYWFGQIVTKLMQDRPLDDITATDAVLARMTPEAMRDVAKKYLNTDNYVKAYLMPKGK
jgi:zinc protease